MGLRYEFYLLHLDYTIHTGGGANDGTDSKVSLRVLRRQGSNWENVSEKLPEPGNTVHLDVGESETFSRSFATPILLGASNDANEYEQMVKFQMQIYGDDLWVPNSIDIKPKFRRRDLLGLVDEFTELWAYGKLRFSTDKKEGYALIDFV